MSSTDSQHLMQCYPSDRLIDGRQEVLTEGNDAVALVDPKFMGFCCGPALSCCCGCSLQFALKAFATISLVLGALGLMAALVSIGMTDPWMSTQSILRGGLLLALGISLWNTAGEVNPRLGQLSSYFLAGVYVVDVVVCILTIIAMASPAFKARLIDELSQQFVSTEKREPSAVELESLKQLAGTLIGTFIGSLVAGITFEGLLYLFVFYFIWSFIVRSKRGEYFLVAYGPNTLPSYVQTQLFTPQYSVYYPQPVHSQQQPPRPSPLQTQGIEIERPPQS